MVFLIVVGELDLTPATGVYRVDLVVVSVGFRIGDPLAIWRVGRLVAVPRDFSLTTPTGVDRVDNAVAVISYPAVLVREGSLSLLLREC